MRRFRSRQFVVLAAVALSTWTCGSTTPTTPTTPTTTPTSVTDVFSSQLTPNGAVTFPFSVTSAGAVSATLTAISPDAGLTLGLALGVMSGTTCELKLTNDTALTGTVVTGTAAAGSIICARVSDASGVVLTSETISVTVTHF